MFAGSRAPGALGTGGGPDRRYWTWKVRTS